MLMFITFSVPYPHRGEQKSMKNTYTFSYFLVLLTLVTLTFLPNAFAQGPEVHTLIGQK